MDLNMDATSQSSLVVAPPIFKLNDDLLLHIFHLNTYTPETEDSEYTTLYTSNSRPLVIARQTSQVCLAWRHTIINSPTIWGSVIDMTILGASSDLWIEEVIKRTGESNLDIYGTVLRKSVASFFNDFLRDNWHRVRRLDICLDPKFLAPPVDARSDTLELPDQPAPMLEKFLLRGSLKLVSDALRSTRGLKIFAPSLRRYHSPVLACIHREPWISQLVSLTLSQPLSTAEVFKVLATTIHLESLTILDVGGLTPGIDREKIHLPKLIRLDISATVTQCVVFLQNIVSHPDCALLLRVKDPADVVIPEQLDILLDLIKPYIVQFFDTHQPSRLTLEVRRRIFSVHSARPTDMRYFAHTEARLSYESNPPSHRVSPVFPLVRENLLSTLISLIPVSLNAVVELEINGHKYSKDDLDSTPGFLKLMKSLSSVEMLDLTPDTFRLLNSGNMAESPIFLPLLNAIKLCAREFMGISEIRQYIRSNFRQDLLSFFSQRKAAGVPVQTLDLTDDRTAQLQYDWRFLDAIGGLSVVWRWESKVLRYTCGSGGEDRLDRRKLKPQRMIGVERLGVGF